MTAFPERLETERLVARRPSLADEPDVRSLMQDPRVTPTLWPWGEGPSVDDVRAGLDRLLAGWERDGFGPWVLADRTTGAFVGRGGLAPTADTGVPEVELAWAVVPERWGEGLATELARAAVQVGFGALDRPTLVAMTLPHNVASRRVMDKLGMRYERDVVHVGLEHVLYRLDRASPSSS